MIAKTALAERETRYRRDTGEVERGEDDRSLLLELASDLQTWSARNVVFRRALDRAAEQLIELAERADSR